MSISREEVRRIAELAELAVEERDLDTLTRELDRIVSYVAQLAGAERDDAEPLVPGPRRTPLREDVVDPEPLAAPPAAFAPEMRDGFFVVPRLAGMEDG